MHRQNNEMQQQLNAFERRPGHAYMIILGPGGSVSPVQQIPTSHPLLADHLPGTMATAHLFDDHLAAAAGLFDHDDAHLLPAPVRSSKRARVVAAAAAIALGLPQTMGRSREGEECAVCQQDFGADETLRAMPCSHAFHQYCVSQWLRRNPICPLCRHRLLPEEDEDDGQIAS
ncbi:unnamed protein product [Urochloa decumbens]|uniref:RING-type domain-containing protein n=1 Tax=Urochloa decumbens TaxID=240449 RepID=A0ABC9A8P7_9POAL